MIQDVLAALGRKALGEVATTALPDTILAWYRLVESARQVQRQVSQRVAQVVHVIRTRMEVRARERAVALDRDIGR